MGNIANFIDKIKHAIYGKDVRDSIAKGIQQCYDDAIANGHTDMEVVQARKTYSNLNARLDAENGNVNNAIQTEKNNRTTADNNLQNQINSLASGSPKGVYATTAALVSANPDTGVYVITADGHIYSWTKGGSSAVDLGVYQATGLANNSVSYMHFDSDLLDKLKIRIPEISLNDGYISGATGAIGSQGNYSYSDPIQLNAHETIVFKSKGYNTAVAMISTCNSNGEDRTPRVRSIDSDIHTYTYTTDVNTFIILSAMKNYFDFFYVISDYATKSDIDTINDALTNYINGKFEGLFTPDLIVPKHNNLITRDFTKIINRCSIEINESNDEIYKYLLTLNFTPDGTINYGYSCYFCKSIVFNSAMNVRKIIGFVDIKGSSNNIYFKLLNQNGTNLSQPAKTVDLSDTNNNEFKRYFIEIDNPSEFTGLRILIGSNDSELPECTYQIRALGIIFNTDIYNFSHNFLTPADIKLINEDIVSSDDGNFDPLKTILRDGGLTNIFTKIGCIGDSLTAGQFESNNEGQTQYNTMDDYSYPAHLNRILNCNVKKFARGGLTAKSWLNYFSEIAFTSENLCECYIIALGTNDIGYNGSFSGAISDINLNNYNNNADTSVGNYGKIIQKIKEAQPKAKIFCCGIPNTRNSIGERNSANTLISAICDLFEDCYFMDFAQYGVKNNDVANWKAIYYMGGHMSSQGYYEWACMVSTYIDAIIKLYPNKFKQIPFIGTDLSHT